jgi:uncharacterized protein (TIGR03437 family)
MLLLSVCAGSGYAQFSGLSATGDGTTVYFSSPLRLRGSPENFDAKLFRTSGDAPALFRAQERGPSLGWYNQYFYDLTAPQVSTDGSIIALTGVRDCRGGSGCIGVQRREGTLTDSSGKVLLSAFGNVNISPNGQYGLFFGRNTWASLVPPTELISIATRSRTTIPYAISRNPRRRVADDGTVALLTADGIRLWQVTGEVALTGASIAPSTDFDEPLLFIGADGRRLVYEATQGLARYDRLTGFEELLSPDVPVSVSIDNNATVVAYVSPTDSQIYIASPARQLTREPEGIAEVALSGDGRVAFAVTRNGRLLRIVVDSGATTELIPRTPFITNPSTLPGIQTYIYDGIAPGSLIPLIGTGLSSGSEYAAPPLPRSLGGVRVRIGGVPAAVHSVSPDVVWIQVPWELPEDENATFEFESGNSLFRTGPGTITVRAQAPHSFATVDTSSGYSIYYTAVHQDWSGLVTPASPARGGEIITVYFNGLGPVAPAVATGETSPADPPARVVGPFRCQFWDGGPNDARVYFAGLAPGMIGIYQVSLEVPVGLRTSPATLSCDFGDASPWGATGSVFVAGQ